MTKQERRDLQEIKSPIEYLEQREKNSSDTYALVEVLRLPVGHNLCNMWAENNNCTIVSVMNILEFYEKELKKRFFSDKEAAHKFVLEKAGSLNYTEKGLPVYKNRKFIRTIYKELNLYAKNKSHYIPTKKSVLRELRQKRPVMLSLASGYYYDHTVTVSGYVTYKNNRTGKCYTFLTLADAWHKDERYLAWTNTGKLHVACMTTTRIR